MRARFVVALAWLLVVSSASTVLAGQPAIEPAQRQMAAVLPDFQATLQDQIDRAL
jgi:hypothetical protein